MSTRYIDKDAVQGYLSVVYDSCTITLDAKNKQVTIADSTGKAINILLADLPAGAQARFQQIQVCVGGVTKTAYVLMTTPS